MNISLNETQIRYVMAKIESDVVGGLPVADQVERELDLALMDDEQRERERFNEACRTYEAQKREEALAYLAGRR